MKLKLNLYLIFFTLIQGVYGRSPVPCLDVPKSEILDQEAVKGKIYREAYFKEINESQKVGTIAFHSCRNDKGMIDVSDEVSLIREKECVLSDFDFLFSVRNDQIQFEEFKVKGKDLSLLDYKENLLKKVIEKTFADNGIKGFLSQMSHCQVKLVREGENKKLFFNLKNKKGDFCFYHSDLSGSEIQLIKRLYAKDNHCDQNS